jgi:hypothetical protein
MKKPAAYLDLVKLLAAGETVSSATIARVLKKAGKPLIALRRDAKLLAIRNRSVAEPKPAMHGPAVHDRGNDSPVTSRKDER